MKCWIQAIFFLFSFSCFADECDLTHELEKKLITNSGHAVDKVECESGVYKWFISNKRYMSFRRETASVALAAESSVDFEKLIRDSKYHIEKITLNEKGHKIWHISNKPYLKGGSEREIASVKENKRELLNEIKKAKKHVLSASLFSGVASIASTDITGTKIEKAVTDIGLGVSLRWSHLWSETVSFFAEGSLRSYKFRVAENRSLSNDSLTQSSVGVGLKFKLSDRFSLSSQFDVRDTLVISSSGASELSLEKLALMTLRTSLRTKLVRFKSGFSLDLISGAGYIFPAKKQGFDSETGLSYSVGIGSSYELDHSNFLIDVSFSRDSIKINDADQRSKDFGVTAGVGWSF